MIPLPTKEEEEAGVGLVIFEVRGGAGENP